MADDRVARVKGCIGYHKDFPKPDIGFRDIFPILRNPSVFKDLLDLIVEAVQEDCPDIECVAGIESRGFLLGPPVAQALEIPFIPLRKKGKLPGELVSFEYQLEYGTDTLELQKSSVKPGQKMLIIDDLMATGGTMKAACDLLDQAGAEVALCLVVIEGTYLHGRDAVGKPIKSIITIDNNKP